VCITYNDILTRCKEILHCLWIFKFTDNVIKINKKLTKSKIPVNLSLVELWPINDQFEDQIEMSSTKVNSVIN